MRVTSFTRVSFLLLLLLMSLQIAQAQVDTTVYQIHTVSGNTYYGPILEQLPDTVVMRTESIGVIRIPRTTIKSIKPVTISKVEGDEVWFENPQEARYFWQPNGYGLKKGEGYYQNVWVLFNHFGYGVTDHFTIGAGIVPLFLFAGTATPVWITPKVSIPIAKEKFNIAPGAMLGYLIGEDGAAFGIPYSVFTYGSRNNNFSIGAGWAFADGEFAENPTITLSGMFRVSRRTYLLTENYYIDAGSEEFFLISLGGRTITRSVGIDYGLVFPTNTGTFVAVPWVGITIPFGNKPAYQ